MVKIKVIIEKAIGLAAADSNGLSDPYVICKTTGLQGVPEARFQTKVIDETLDPEWNHVAEIDYTPGQDLQFQVFDKDGQSLESFGLGLLKSAVGQNDDFLGHCALEAGNFYPNGFKGALKLDDAGECEEGLLVVEVLVMDQYGHYPAQEHSSSARGMSDRTPEIGTRSQSRNSTRAISFTSEGSSTGSPMARIKVLINRAVELAGVDYTGKSDPYVVCELMGREETRFRTEVVDQELNPQWNHVQELDYLPGEDLLFHVFDKKGQTLDFVGLGHLKRDVGQHDVSLGYAKLPGEHFYPHGYTGELRLEEAGDARVGVLLVEVIIMMVAGRQRSKGHPDSKDIGGRLPPTSGARRSSRRGQEAFAEPFSTRALSKSSVDSGDRSRGVSFAAASGPLLGACRPPTAGPPTSFQGSGVPAGSFVRNSMAPQAPLPPFGTIGSGQFGSGNFSNGSSGRCTGFGQSSGQSSGGWVPNPAAEMKAQQQDNTFGSAPPPPTHTLGSEHSFAGAPKPPTGTLNSESFLEGIVGSCQSNKGKPRQSGTSSLTCGSMANGEMLSQPDASMSVNSDSQRYGSSSALSPACFSSRPAGSVSRGAVAQAQRLRVTIIGAKGLNSHDFMAKSNPYCVCDVQGKSPAKFETNVVKESGNPTWNFNCEFDYIPGDPIVFSVIDRDYVQGHNLLGTATFMPQTFSHGAVVEELALEGTGAALKIQVAPLGVGTGASAYSGSASEFVTTSTKHPSLRSPPSGYGGTRSRPQQVLQPPQRGSTAVGLNGREQAFEQHRKREGGIVSVPTPNQRVRDSDLFGRLRDRESRAPTPHYFEESAPQRILICVRGVRKMPQEDRARRPYCICETEGTSSSSTSPATVANTRTAYGQGDPFWNHEQEYAGYIPGDSLQFYIMAGDGNDFCIGSALLRCEQFYPYGFQGELTLLCRGRGIRGLLQVKVVVPQAAAYAASAMRNAHLDLPVHGGIEGLSRSGTPARLALTDRPALSASRRADSSPQLDGALVCNPHHRRGPVAISVSASSNVRAGDRMGPASTGVPASNSPNLGDKGKPMSIHASASGNARLGDKGEPASIGVFASASGRLGDRGGQTVTGASDDSVARLGHSERHASVNASLGSVARFSVPARQASIGAASTGTSLGDSVKTVMPPTHTPSSASASVIGGAGSSLGASLGTASFGARHDGDLPMASLSSSIGSFVPARQHRAPAAASCGHHGGLIASRETAYGSVSAGCSWQAPTQSLGGRSMYSSLNSVDSFVPAPRVPRP